MGGTSSKTPIVSATPSVGGFGFGFGSSVSTSIANATPVPPIPNANSKSILNQEQLQKAMYDSFTSYATSKSANISKIGVDLPKLQQCFDSNSLNDCVVQYVKGFDDSTSTFTDLNAYGQNIISDAGGIASSQNFELFELIENNNCVLYSANTIILFLLAIFILGLIIKRR